MKKHILATEIVNEALRHFINNNLGDPNAKLPRFEGTDDIYLPPGMDACSSCRIDDEGEDAAKGEALFVAGYDFERMRPIRRLTVRGVTVYVPDHAVASLEDFVDYLNATEFVVPS